MNGKERVNRNRWLLNILVHLTLQYFKFKVENESTRYTIPISVTEGSDSFTVNSSWTKQNVQGSTEGMVAFNYVDNPTLNISIKFNEDICRELNSSQSFEKIVSKLVALQYPGEKSGAYCCSLCMGLVMIILLIEVIFQIYELH